MREKTLDDHIGERMRSRLQEMCPPIDMTGQDSRQNVTGAFLAEAQSYEDMQLQLNTTAFVGIIGASAMP